MQLMQPLAWHHKRDTKLEDADRAKLRKACKQAFAKQAQGLGSVCAFLNTKHTKYY